MKDSNQQKNGSIKNYYLSLKLDPRAYDYNSLIQKLIDILNGRDLGNLDELEWSEQRRLINAFMLTLENYGGKENYDKALIKEYGILLPIDLSKKEEFTDYRELDFEEDEKKEEINNEPELKELDEIKNADPEKELDEFLEILAKKQNVIRDMQTKLTSKDNASNEISNEPVKDEEEIDLVFSTEEPGLVLPEEKKDEPEFALNVFEKMNAAYNGVELNKEEPKIIGKIEDNNDLIFSFEEPKVILEEHKEEEKFEPNLFEGLLEQYASTTKKADSEIKMPETKKDGELNFSGLTSETKVILPETKEEANEEVVEENVIEVPAMSNEELNSYLDNLAKEFDEDNKRNSKKQNEEIVEKWHEEEKEFEKAKLNVNLKFFKKKAGKVILVTTTVILGTVLVAVGLNNSKETTAITAYKGETLNQVMETYDINRFNIKNEPFDGDEKFLSNQTYEVTKYIDAEEKIADINRIDAERREERNEQMPELYKFYYLVTYGDTLSGLKERFNYAKIVKEEPGTDLYYGEEVIMWTDKKELAKEMNSRYEAKMAEDMPTSFTYYTVQDGDTLAAIANAHGANILDILEYNEIADPDCIATGNVIKIPVFEQTKTNTK